MKISYKLIAVSGFVLLVVYWLYKVLNWVWFRPKKLEKCLRVQGLKGNSYRPFLGDQYESGKLIREALSKPININADIKDRVIPHILKTFRDHGKNSFMWVGRIPRVHITEPEQIREVLTKYYRFQKNHHSFDPITKHLLTGIGSLEGEPWAKHRRVINAAFHFEKLKLMLPAFYESCHDLVSKWESKVPDSGSAEVEVWHDIETLTADVISRTLFGSNYEEGKRIFELMRELTVLTIQVIRSVYIPGRRFLPTKRNNRIRAIDKEARVRIREIINNKMKAMKAGEVTSDDFLGILLECNVNEIQQHGNNQSAGMRIEEIIGECKLFYFAGQDTTSTLLVWTMVILSRFPEWQARAREEVLQVFGDKKPDYDGISRLKIVTMILYEVLRLYPPVVELTKVAHEDTKLGEVFIPAGVQVMLPTILLHHDPEIWGKDVMEFKPERFCEGVLKATKNQGSFFPFSLGPRMCIGQNFALLEAKMAMALILLRFSFELSPSYVHAPLTLITLQPQHGAHLVLHRL
uniref:Cytochrome P450 n=1 Tax=Nothapodytes nimmoniana TaxID=159386 RepID=A0A7L7RBA1_NOTNI|nr:cytochrome P450 [Nothapodytes nimmoniana]